MASIVLYFQVHQPYRLARYSVFDSHPFYFDTAKNGEICRKVADKCYRPATALILDLVRRHKGSFRVSYAMTGVVLDQMAEFCPDVLDLFRRLADTGCCEFIGETYHHSLSFLYSRQEFLQQVEMHTRKIQELFGQTPTVFRNTELIYNNDLAHAVRAMRDGAGNPRFYGTICEGADRVLGYRSPNYVYSAPGMGGPGEAGSNGAGSTRGGGGGRDGRPFGLLLKNYRLSDDIAFRFSDRGWGEWPLSAERFAGWVDQINGNGFLCNLFMDYETFGEHQWAETGIFRFLDALPEKVFDVNPGQNHFITPSMALRQFDPVGEYDAPNFISWADTERDLSAWLGNAMQSNALQEIYRLEHGVKARLGAAEHQGQRRGIDGAEIEESRHLLADWRKLTTSDHFYYMCTKYFADGDVHKYFNPYDSPYESYINFMNVLDNVRARVTAGAGEAVGTTPLQK